MSKVKLIPNQYIGSHELNRFQQFLSDDVAKLILSTAVERFGVIDAGNPDSLNVEPATSLRVVTIGSSLGGGGGLQPISNAPGAPGDFDTIGSGRVSSAVIAPGYAVDSNLRAIRVPEPTAFPIPAPGTPNSTYYVLISHATTNLETGRVTVGTDGSLRGEQTAFTKTLRGTPGEPNAIRFPDSTRNTGEYPIAEVLSDDLALANAVGMYAEADLRYEVLGSYPSDVYVRPSDKAIYVHDYFRVEVYPFLPADTDDRIPVAKIRYDSNGYAEFFDDMRAGYMFSLK